ncbi:hypothetical protein AAFF_G00103860 [Aldrovandia affinis]|uniref:Uncharacterized protein n=1 Tax=Aldrovandia affinis TaxID=143900 RepID=A0AAD7RU48_9TELE|nr:hypothetical protein AAFF_G00103860 [Aldrovandia affinis]
MRRAAIAAGARRMLSRAAVGLRLRTLRYGSRRTGSLPRREGAGAMACQVCRRTAPASIHEEGLSHEEMAKMDA